MGKTRQIKVYNEYLTGILDLEGYVVVDGDINYMTVRCRDKSIPICEECQEQERLGARTKTASQIKNQGKFSKDYYDIIRLDDGTFKVVTIHHEFNKYRCLNCGAVFQKPVYFASIFDHVTKRFEDYVMALISVMSYSQASNRLMIFSTDNDGYINIYQTVSKQSISRIVERWTIAREAERGIIRTPEILGIMKFISDKKEYVLAFDAGDNDLRLLEVITPVDDLSIESFLRSMDVHVIKGLVTDCDPIIVDACRATLPTIELMVSTDSLLQQAIEDFDSLIHDDASHIENHKKAILKKSPEQVAKNTRESNIVRDITNKHPLLSVGYDYVNELRTILKRDWDAVDIMEWSNKTPTELEKYFISAITVSEYWNEMLRYYMRRNEISGDLYKRLLTLNKKVNQFKYYSANLFKSRLLYIPAAYDDHVVINDQWCGVSCEKALLALDDMLNKREGIINEQLWQRF